MTKNPLINALSASAYIGIVVAVMNFVSNILRNKPDSIIAPIAILSIFTLSVTVMAYLFFYQPFLLFIEGKKKEAVDLFVRSVGFFGVFTIFFLVLLFLGVV